MADPSDGFSIPFGIAAQLANDPGAALNQARVLVSDPSGFVQSLTLRSSKIGVLSATFTVEGKAPAATDQPSGAVHGLASILNFLELEAVIETPAGPLPPIPIRV